MSGDPLEKRFLKRMRELLVLLPYDMKVFFEAMSDENLPAEARYWAAGGALYCLSPVDAIPDTSGLMGYLDDVIAFRFALKRFLELGGEESRSYPERFPEQFNMLDQDLVLIKDFFGDLSPGLFQRLERYLLTTRYKGKDAKKCVEDEEAAEFLFEEGQIFSSQYEVDDESAAKLQNGNSVREAFRKRISEEAQKRNS